MEQVEVVPAGRATLRVPTFMYHYIRVNPNRNDTLGFNLSVAPDDFRKQMDALRDRGYHPVTFNEMRAYWTTQQPLPSKPVVLTFDDGYLDFFTTAYPILKDHGFKSVSYVVPGFLNGPNYMSTPQVVQLDSEGLVEFASHTVAHVDLTKSSASQVTSQLTESKRALEQMLNHPVLDFCYPSGMYNSSVVAAVQAAGYQTGTTTQPGLVHSMSDRYVWTRQRVNGGETLAAFLNDLGQEEPTITIVRAVPVRTAPLQISRIGYPTTWTTPAGRFELLPLLP
jgi:peptidoglycan/xylan/chitin deacetylase (PgdA/CDA1 family)